MDGPPKPALSDAEVYAFFDRLFPHGLAGADVLAEIAPDGWERSPLLACFHPSIERVFEERLRFHRNLEDLSRIRRRRRGDREDTPRPEPTLDEVRREHEETPARQEEEVTELIGMCLWDVFSDNHEVLAADGRLVDLGSFRGSSAFLDEYVTSKSHRGRSMDGDYLGFYLGTSLIGGRADLAPIYAMIFRRLREAGADWVYHFPELHLVELGEPDEPPDGTTGYSVTRSALADVQRQKDRAETERLKAELAASHARAREEALDRPAPETVRAYRQVYGRDPGGWPPA